MLRHAKGKGGGNMGSNEIFYALNDDGSHYYFQNLIINLAINHLLLLLLKNIYSVIHFWWNHYDIPKIGAFLSHNTSL